MKTRCHLTTLMAASLLLTACSSDDTPAAVTENVELNIVANAADLEQGSSTRAGSPHQDTQFDQNQIIDVYIREGGTLTGGNNGYGTSGKATTTYTQPVRAKASNATGTFAFIQAANTNAYTQYWPSSGNGVIIYAWHPTTGVAARLNTFHEVAQNQSDKSSADNYKNSDLMFGLPSANVTSEPNFTFNAETEIKRQAYASSGRVVPLTFFHLLSKVVIKLAAGSGLWGATTPGTVDANKLKNAKITIGNVYTKVKITNATNGTVATQTGTSDPQKLVTLLAQNDKNTLTSNQLVAYCILPAQNLKNKTISVQLADASGSVEYKYTFGSDFNIEARKVHEITMTVTPTELKVSSTKIVDWNDGGDTSGNLTITTAGS